MASMEQGTRRSGLNTTLRQVLDNENIEENRRQAEEMVNNVVEEIVNYLKDTETSPFGGQAERLNIGSYHETLKVSV